MFNFRVHEVAGDKTAGAVFDIDRLYRYSLWRVWNEKLPKVLFVMLNPSTADEKVLDPTVTRCVGYAKRWGYGGLLVGNLFALRATNPKRLYSARDPVGPTNDAALLGMLPDVELVVAAWGNYGGYLNRGPYVAKMLVRVEALGVTKNGHPAHPLYLRGEKAPAPFSYAEPGGKR
ncbi:MAG TPA: DUF1643 domain-containing protein [Thermoplasmata archaeon]|jgi:hypothetical protein